MGGRPTLWHIEISHFSEKARWALDFKGVDYARRSPPPPSHMPIALALTAGRHWTFPVLQLDGRRIGDSTAIVAALEEAHPQPALLPADPAQRRRALELEDFFDEELGPHVRLLAWHEVARDPQRLEQVAVALAPGPLKRFGGVAGAGARAFVGLRYGAHDEERAAVARRRVLAAFDRLEAELGDREHLVGDTFTVADLTAASLLYPVVLPPGSPPFLAPVPDRLERFRAPLRERRGFRWVEGTYARYR